MSCLRETFVNNLRFYRKKKGFSQEKLSFEIGKSIAYINQIENKDTWPQPEIIDRIAKVLDIEPSILFEETGCPENIKNQFTQKFGDSLENQLMKKIEEAVNDVCKNL